MNSREKYAQLAKKKRLPKLEELEANFAFKLSRDSEDFFFDIIKGIEESIIYARHVMENLLFLGEESQQSQVYESGFANREELFNAYRKLMELKWKYRQVYFNTTENNCEDFIKESNVLWAKDVKPHILKVCGDMENAWKIYRKGRQEKQRYFG